MEAQLIFETPAVPEPSRAIKRPSCDALVRKLDSYLAAAGASDELLSRRVTLRTLESLQGDAELASLPWVKVVATLDRVLKAELLEQPESASHLQGRIALRQNSSNNPAARTGYDWATPPRRYQAMPASSLAPWRPSWRQLNQFQVPRFAQGIAACLCWLAVLVLP